MRKDTGIQLDHADIVVTHKCNMHCPHCIDPLVNTSDDIVSVPAVDRFMRALRDHMPHQDMDILFLGGEPTCAGLVRLKALTSCVRSHGFRPIISTNGLDKSLIKWIQPEFDWVQVTTHSAEETAYWAEQNDTWNNINLKIAGDGRMTYEKLMDFIDLDASFRRRSVSMYFTPDFKELCTDKDVWALLDTMDWERNGSYMYAMYEGVRFKKCIPSVTNIVDEPTVPKLYPNGNYNKTWCNEELDDYLSEDRWNAKKEEEQ